MTDLLTRARIQYAQLTEASPYNRSERPSAAGAALIVLERLFGSDPAVMGEIKATEEWEQLERNSPLHPEQFETFVARFAPKEA